LNKTSICAISDLHGNLPRVLPDADILLIAGDICPATQQRQQGQWISSNLIPWMQIQPFKHIVFCAGNHDCFFEELMIIDKENAFRKSLPKDIHYLRDSLVEINGIKIWGSPWSKIFYDWAFMRSEEDLDKIYSKIPENIDILISHGPANGYSDRVEQYYENEHLGSVSLAKHIDRVKPEYVFVGHIHSGNHNIVEKIVDNRTIKFANVSILDEGYEPFYKPNCCLV